MALAELLIYCDDVAKFTVRASTALKVAELIAILALVNLAMYGGATATKTSGWALVYGPPAQAFWGGVVVVGMIPVARSRKLET